MESLSFSLNELTRKQTAAAARHAELAAKRAEAGRKGMKNRWHNRRITKDNNVINENENEDENINKTKNETENGTRTPQAATVSPSFLDDSFFVSSVTPDDAAIDAAIDEAARKLGDERPSRQAWREFCNAHGVDEFKRIVGEVAGMDGVKKPGAYLNKRLESYEPPPQPPKPRPPTYTEKDWELCKEQCARFDAAKCCCPLSKHPPISYGTGRPKPPRECGGYTPKEDG